MPKITKTKRVKGWYVDIKIKKPPNNYFSGDGHFRAYRTRKEALAEWGGYDVKIIPVEITYKIKK